MTDVIRPAGTIMVPSSVWTDSGMCFIIAAADAHSKNADFVLKKFTSTKTDP